MEVREGQEGVGEGMGGMHVGSGEEARQESEQRSKP